MRSRRSKPRRTRKARHVHHKKAFTRPDTLSLLNDLRRRWKKLDSIDRGDRLLELVNRGCTRRGLANDLHQSPTTIRRHIEIFALSDSEKDAIRRGSSAKDALRRYADKRWRDFRDKLAAYEKSTNGEISSYAAQFISDFLVNPKQKVKIGPGDVERLFEEVTLKYRLGSAWTGMQRRTCRITDPKKIIRSCRPAVLPKKSENLWFDMIVEWVARIADSLTQVESIRDKALSKVEALTKQAFEDRRAPAQWKPAVKYFDYVLHPKR